MTPLRNALARIAEALKVRQARFALVGGLAVSVRTLPRFTHDIDVAVVVSGDAEAEELVHQLRGDGFRAVVHLEQEAAGRMAGVRLTMVGGAAPVIDLLFASSGIEREVVAAAEELEVLPGVRLPVARPPHLLALKVLARDDRSRPQDRGDALALLRVCSAEEIEETRSLLRLIQSRGYGRGRDLETEFAAL